MPYELFASISAPAAAAVLLMPLALSLAQSLPGGLINHSNKTVNRDSSSEDLINVAQCLKGH